MFASHPVALPAQQELLDITDTPLPFDRMSIPPADEESLLRSAGYYPETSSAPGSPPTLQPLDQRQHYQNMVSSGATAYNDPVPRYSSPVSAITNFESNETSSAGLGITQPGRLSQRAGSRASSPNQFNPSSSRPAPDTSYFPNLFENSYIENASGTPRLESEGDMSKGKNIFSESPGLPSVTIDEVPRATLTGTPMSMNDSEYDNDNLSMGTSSR